MKRVVMVLMILAVVFVLAGCFPSTVYDAAEKPAGFLLGIWHGWIAPVSLIVGLFNGNVTIFDSNNTGFWYEFGFYIAIIGGFGGLSLFRKKKGHRDNRDD